MSAAAACHPWNTILNEWLRLIHEFSQRAPKWRPPLQRTAFCYIGRTINLMPHELMQDTRLTPLERNAWQVLHYLVVERKVEYPRYKDLQPYLAIAPGSERASRETVARALSNLRLTRWLSRVSHRRDLQGRLRPPVYVLHDTPLTPSEALQLDEGYGELIQQSLKHAAKGIQITAKHVLAELQRDTTVPKPLIPKVLSLVPASPQQQSLSLEEKPSEQPSVDAVRTVSDCHKSSELRSTPQEIRAVRNTCAPSTVQKRKEQKRTVPRAEASSEPDWPAALALGASERAHVLRAMDGLDSEAKDAVLREAAARCSSGGVRRPVAYLMGVIRKAVQGDFRTWAADRTPVASVPGPLPAQPMAPEPPPAAAPARSALPVEDPVFVPEPRPAHPKPRAASPIALECLAQLRQRVGLSSSA